MTSIAHALSVDVEDWFQVLNMAHRIDRSQWDRFELRCVDATRRLRRHEALQYLVAHEPGVILPYTSFDGIQPLLDLAAATVAPLLERHLPTSSAPQQAAELSEWLVRVVLAYALDVDDEAVVDLTDPADTRRFVTTFAVPGVEPDQPGPDRTQP